MSRCGIKFSDKTGLQHIQTWRILKNAGAAVWDEGACLPEVLAAGCSACATPLPLLAATAFPLSSAALLPLPYMSLLSNTGPHIMAFVNQAGILSGVCICCAARAV